MHHAGLIIKQKKPTQPQSIFRGGVVSCGNVQHPGNDHLLTTRMSGLSSYLVVSVFTAQRTFSDSSGRDFKIIKFIGVRLDPGKLSAMCGYTC